MDALSAISFFAMTFSLLGGFAAAAVAWGKDSRPRIGDDHAR
jgi:hypothetical protein